MHGNVEIPGYDFGSPSLARSPVSIQQLRSLEQAAGFDENAREWLRKAAKLITPHAEEIVDSWRALIAAHPEMVQVFFGPDGRPDETYKASVKKRFVQWVIDSCEREHDQAWLDYQEEIGRRHTPAKKSLTEDAHTPPIVPLRYMVAFAGVVCTTIRPFLERRGQSAADVQQMLDAWTKSMLLHLALWARSYVADCLW